MGVVLKPTKPLSMDDILKKRGAGHRLQMEVGAAMEGEMTDEQMAFIQNVEKYRHAHNIRFLRHTDYLLVARAMGYRRVAAT